MLFVFVKHVLAFFASGSWTSSPKFSSRFSSTMPSLAAKKASTCLMKCCSFLFSFGQSFWSWERSISSAVQKEATCFLYISQISLSESGNITNRLGFAIRRGSVASSGCCCLFVDRGSDTANFDSPSATLPDSLTTAWAAFSAFWIWTDILKQKDQDIF